MTYLTSIALRAATLSLGATVDICPCRRAQFAPRALRGEGQPNLRLPVPKPSGDEPGGGPRASRRYGHRQPERRVRRLRHLRRWHHLRHLAPTSSRPSRVQTRTCFGHIQHKVWITLSGDHNGPSCRRSTLTSRWLREATRSSVLLPTTAPPARMCHVWSVG